MRLNKYVARITGRSRRDVDDLIKAGRIAVNGETAAIGGRINPARDEVRLDGNKLRPYSRRTLIAMNKPVGYVCSRRAQAADAKTIYELLPTQYSQLKTIGRLDKDSSGLILLTDDGDLAFRLTHPSFHKTKEYLVKLDRPLTEADFNQITGAGVEIGDGQSRLGLASLRPSEYRVTMNEGRNRQIRRTFAALGYSVKRLHRVKFDDYDIAGLKPGEIRRIDE